MRKLTLLFATTVFLMNTQCSETSSSSGVDLEKAAATYFRTSSSITTHVYYESGAAPFVGTIGLSTKQLWSIYSDNLTSIFQYRSSPPTLHTPTALADMTQIATQNKSSWTNSDILSLHAQYTTGTSSDTESHFYIYFVNGYYNDGSSNQTGVIGVSLGGTTVIAIFKDVVNASGGNATQKYVEQSTLVHETGHALGFVNNGVPMVTAHQDTAHGAHDTNTNGVMYWENEGSSAMATFVQQYITSGSDIMWGTQVLQDAQAFSR